MVILLANLALYLVPPCDILGTKSIALVAIQDTIDLHIGSKARDELYSV